MDEGGAQRLAEEVRLRRQLLRMSQGALAERGGPSELTVRKIERAEGGPYRGKTLLALDQALSWKPGTAAAFLDGTAGTEPRDWVVPGDDEPEFGPERDKAARQRQTRRLIMQLLPRLVEGEYGAEGKHAAAWLAAVLKNMFQDTLDRTAWVDELSQPGPDGKTE